MERLLAKELQNISELSVTLSLFLRLAAKSRVSNLAGKKDNAQMEPLQRIISVYKANLGSLVHQLPSILNRLRADGKSLHLPGRAEISSVMKGLKVFAASLEQNLF